MRLLDTETGQFIEFHDVGKLPAYAILSHTWDPQGEQTYQELRDVQANFSAGTPLLKPGIPPPATETPAPSCWNDPSISAKVRMACVIAHSHGYRYIWIDSCCIDKTSSAELSEAINSMYRWYGKAAICYAFLADVSSDMDVASQIRRSRWFTRGWTLQELIAPRNVVFLSQNCQVLGSKSTLAPLLEEITGIERMVLTHQKHLDAVSVATRMSWASRRTTTRVEDEAYSLLGIFDINMPTLYGEGRRAFGRLQEEIFRQIPDQSLFAWGTTYLSSPQARVDQHHDPGDSHAPRAIQFIVELDNEVPSLFAPSPSYFGHADHIRAVPLEVANRRLGRDGAMTVLPIPSYTATPYGMRTELLLLDVQYFPYRGSIRSRYTSGQWLLAILACEHAQREGELLARLCFTRSSSSLAGALRAAQLYRKDSAGSTPNLGETGSFVPCQLLSLSTAHLRRFHSHLSVQACYIPYLTLGLDDAPPGSLSHPRRWTGRCTLPKWQDAVLQAQGYTVTTRAQAPDAPSGLYCLTISGAHAITLEYQYRLGRQPSGGPVADDEDTSGLGSEVTRSDSLEASHTPGELTVWLDAAVAPSSPSVPVAPAPAAGTISHELSGPYVWVDFCLQRFEFPEITLRTSESIEDGDGSLMRLTRTIRLKVAIEPIAETDSEGSSYSHHILVELVEGGQLEDLQFETDAGVAGDVLSGPADVHSPSRGIKDDQKGGGSWASRFGQRFKRGLGSKGHSQDGNSSSSNVASYLGNSES